MASNWIQMAQENLVVRYPDREVYECVGVSDTDVNCKM